MAQQTSIHICPVKGGSELHNERRKVLDYIRPEFTPKNQVWKSPDFQAIDEQHARIKADYQTAHGKKMHANATPIREAVVVIQEDTTMQQLLSACAKCRERFGIEAMQIYTHRDEGHAAEDGTWKPNLHAHIVFNWYSFNTHTTHKLSPQDMAEMQTLFAESLEMERGISSDRKYLTAIQQKIQSEQAKLERLQKQVDEKQNVAKQVVELNTKATRLKAIIDSLLGFSRGFEEALKKVARAQEILSKIDKAITSGKLTRRFPPSDGFCRVQRPEDNRFNFVNLQTAKFLTTNGWFDAASDFCNGLATVFRGNTMATINTEGIVTEKFEEKISNNQKF